MSKESLSSDWLLEFGAGELHNHQAASIISIANVILILAILIFIIILLLLIDNMVFQQTTTYHNFTLCESVKHKHPSTNLCLMIIANEKMSVSTCVPGNSGEVKRGVFHQSLSEFFFSTKRQFPTRTQ